MVPEGTHSLTMKSERLDDRCVVHCSGDLVAGGCGFLQKTITQLLPDSKMIVLDLTDLEWVDSMGLGTLVRLHVACKAGGSQLKLVNVGKRIKELLVLTNLVSIFA
jgi:anti-sigma B factor antagonist